MKKITVALALLASVAAVAHAAEVRPSDAPRSYFCFYGGTRAGEGPSTFDYTVFDLRGTPLLRGTESYTIGGVRATRKFAFAHPASLPNGTRWEFTFEPGGPQCTQADVLYSGVVITISGCSDGHTRGCYLLSP